MIVEIPREPGFFRTVSSETDAVRLPIPVSYARGPNLAVAVGFGAGAVVFGTAVWGFTGQPSAPCATVADWWFAAAGLCLFTALALYSALAGIAFGRTAFLSGPILTVNADGIVLERSGATIAWAEIVSADLTDDIPWLVLAGPNPNKSSSHIGKILDWAVELYFRSRRLGLKGKVPLTLGFMDATHWRLNHVIALLVSRSGGTAAWRQPGARVISV